MSEFEGGSECGLVFNHIFEHPTIEARHLNPRQDLTLFVASEDLHRVPIIPYTVVPLVALDVSHDHVTLGLDLEYLVHHQPLCDTGGIYLVSCLSV